MTEFEKHVTEGLDKAQNEDDILRIKQRYQGESTPFSAYISRNLDSETTEDELKELRAQYIRETTGYIVVQALSNMEHGGNLLFERAFERLNDNDVHGAKVTYEELRNQFHELGLRIEWAIEEVEGF